MGAFEKQNFVFSSSDDLIYIFCLLEQQCETSNIPVES